MSETGKIVWTDLTVKNAEEVKVFYTKVIGWEASPHDMGEYNDFNINLADGGATIAGICHARGSNASLPPQWLMYVKVEDVDSSAERCVEAGGKVIEGPREMGGSRFCVIQDPAGAVLALIK